MVTDSRSLNLPGPYEGAAIEALVRQGTISPDKASQTYVISIEPK